MDVVEGEVEFAGLCVEERKLVCWEMVSRQAENSTVLLLMAELTRVCWGMKTAPQSKG